MYKQHDGASLLCPIPYIVEHGTNGPAAGVSSALQPIPLCGAPNVWRHRRFRHRVGVGPKSWPSGAATRFTAEMRAKAHHLRSAVL